MTEVQLKDILDKKHALYQLADRLNWDALIEGFGPYYSEGPGSAYFGRNERLFRSESER